MLARWQGENEVNFVGNSVSYDPSAFTGLSGGTKKGVSPESSAGSSLVQRDCYSTGFLINTWSTPHRPITGGGYNDMFGYAWTTPPYAFVRGGNPADLVIQSEIAVPHYGVWGSNTTAQVGLFAYLKDMSNPTYPPFVVLAMTHMSNYTPVFRLASYDYTKSSLSGNPRKSSADLNSAYPNWQIAANNDGVCFFSASIESGNTTYVTPGFYQGYNGFLTSALTTSGASNKHFRAHITPSNLSAIVGQINSANCPFRPGPYSTNASNYVVEYAGVIAEVVLDGEWTTGFDTSRSNWVGKSGGTYNYNDTGKAQSSLGVKLYDTGILQYQ